MGKIQIFGGGHGKGSFYAESAIRFSFPKQLFQITILSLKFEYRISSYSFRGNYYFLNLKIQSSQYIKVRKLFKGGNYSRAETI